MYLQNLTIDELSVLDKPNTFVIIPLASCEQHGPHLPFGTKSFLSETIAYMACNKLRDENYSCIIAPTVPFMPCKNNSGFPGVFSMSTRTYSDALFEIASSFANEGFKCVFFVNMSVSPDALKAVATAIEDLNAIDGFRAFDPMPLWSFTQDEVIEDYLKSLKIEPKNEIHADVKETSALLAIDPSLVRSKILSRLEDCKVNSSWEMLKGNFSFKEMGSLEGYLGSPSKSSKEFGELFLTQAVNALTESMKYVSEGNELPDLPLQIRTILKMVDMDEI